MAYLPNMQTLSVENSLTVLRMTDLKLRKLIRVETEVFLGSLKLANKILFFLGVFEKR